LWKAEPKIPTDAESAFQSENFYAHSVSGEAAVVIFAPVPIHKPDGAGVATANRFRRCGCSGTGAGRDDGAALNPVGLR